MAEEWKVQLNVKMSDHLLNVRGDSSTDVLGELDTFSNLGSEFNDIINAIKSLDCFKSSGVHAGANSYGGGAGQGGAGSPGGYQAGGQNTAGRGCIHGPMTYREGTGARGPWKGWFGPEPKGSPNACKAVFQNG